MDPFARAPPLRQRQPPCRADDLTVEPEWDVQVARVGLTPLAPTIRVASLRATTFHARIWLLSGELREPACSREILSRPA